MFNDDPLTNWLEFSTFTVPLDRLPSIQKNLHLTLMELVDYLDSNPAKPDFTKLHFHSLFGPVGFAEDELELAQDTYIRVVESSGNYSNKIQESLLFLIGATANPLSVSFWLELVDLYLPRDMIRAQRQQGAIAALAFCAIKSADTAVYHSLHKLTHHTDPTIRAQAIYYLSRAYTEAVRSFPESLIADMTIVATEDTNFEPRFQARRILRLANEPIPFDNPEGVYDLKVTLLSHPRCLRTIAIRSQQTLKDLQRFIQHAFDWDNDHLFCFYMNGRKYDDQYRYSCAYEKDRPPWAYEVQIGQLGLVKNHHFLYHYDYGDDHLFEIIVEDIRPYVPPGNYPRLIHSYGKAPRQYQ